MTDDQQLIAEARACAAIGQGLGLHDTLIERLADALSAAVARNAELQEIFDGGYGEFEESIKDREAKRYRAAIGNWRASALKAEAELASAAVRYRAEGWAEGWQAYRDHADEWVAASMNDKPLPTVNPYRAQLDENNETQDHQKDGQ